MRTSILLWSTFSGVVLGVFVDALLIGAVLLASAVMPSALPRPSNRWATLAVVGVLTGIPLALGILGLLEGRLKAK
jgi:hypothetical protein